MSHILDIETARCYISCYENFDQPFSEFTHYLFPPGLGIVPMKCISIVPHMLEFLAHLIDISFSVTKNDGERRIFHIQQPSKCI